MPQFDFYSYYSTYIKPIKADKVLYSIFCRFDRKARWMENKIVRERDWFDCSIIETSQSVNLLWWIDKGIVGQVEMDHREKDHLFVYESVINDVFAHED